jgi:hypothetical protein
MPLNSDQISLITFVHELFRMHDWDAYDWEGKMEGKERCLRFLDAAIPPPKKEALIPIKE